MNQNDKSRVEALLQLFREQGLQELTVADSEFKLSLRREAPAVPAAVRAVPAAQTSHIAQAAAPVKPKTEDAAKGRTVAVRSPLIGVFYRSPSPDSPSFVNIGDQVAEGQTVCIIEAMKVFNEIKAEWSGRVVAIPPENGALVQAGDPLVVLEFPQASS